MAKLQFPLWFVNERNPKVPPAQPPCGDLRATLAFTTLQRLEAFLVARHSGQWKVTLIGGHEDFVLILADLHDDGEQTICLDPEIDGSGGRQVAIADLFAISE